MAEHLEHYGVKGMKWGVRRRSRRKYPIGPIRENIPVAAAAVKNSRPVGPGTGHRNYDIKKLSNKELKKVVDRMALEKRYNEINAYPSDKGKLTLESFLKDQGRGLLKQIGTEAQKQTATAIVSATLGSALKKDESKDKSKKEKKS